MSTRCIISKIVKKRLSSSNLRGNQTWITDTRFQRCSFNIGQSKIKLIRLRSTTSRSGISIRMTIKSTVSRPSSYQESQFSSLISFYSTRRTRKGRFFTRVAQAKSLSFAGARRLTAWYCASSMQTQTRCNSTRYRKRADSIDTLRKEMIDSMILALQMWLQRCSQWRVASESWPSTTLTSWPIRSYRSTSTM